MLVIKTVTLILMALFLLSKIQRFVTLSPKDNQKLSKGFERSAYWNEYKTKIENKNVTNWCRHFLVSNFVGVNRFFALICSNE